MYYVYLLKSVRKPERIYIGSTKDLKKRLQEHNSNKSHFTKNYSPWELIYYEAYKSEKDARVRESKLKQHGKGKQELKKRLLFSLQKGAG
ncbi:MAG: hypothetical protein US60_C0020G0018 [Microgenomates group bacterium GW2011_GWC1_37_8]|uniref:GIY-YIG domain-containing protein n=1 Tax=Candidatus Woesebacteria bacterium GW2011_GWB1_38_8 TaxID=1618570 RepID=A0A0G0L9Z9_9BACT|nr:MAG: hypothetical protein US60_C0020G0018 [Microgenomates group bacterium GW2011_GWC1_37_8]KKQ84670.1 MAG: hypothetical protein UT08_C0015G0006 [Candidatus Woesebacteria bacterium GW2011_GWB1_38_8]